MVELHTPPGKEAATSVNGNRKLFFWGSSKTGLPETLERSGWVVFSTRSVAEIARICQGEGIRVAIVLLPKQFEASVKILEEGFVDLPELRVITLVGRDGLANVELCRLIQSHCFDYHTLPIDRDRLLHTLGHAWGMAALAEPKMQPLDGSELRMVGSSQVMCELYEAIRQVRYSDATILIRGEPGTGKELVAKAIHYQSPRKKQPFVPINCGASPDILNQTELFGHEEGAFAGAVQQRIGRIEAADGGTVFLDEVGDLPMASQANLLRFMQEGTIERLGGTDVIPVDARVIAASHIDLEQRVAKGLFREDLFHRLNVLPLSVPPLRERNEDIVDLAEYYFEKFVRDNKTSGRTISRATLMVMRQYQWPGNVRELMNRLQRALVMSKRAIITPSDLGLERRQKSRPVLTLEQVKSEAEREALINTLSETNHNVALSARLLGVSRVTLYRLLQKYQLVSQIDT